MNWKVLFVGNTSQVVLLLSCRWALLVPPDLLAFSWFYGGIFHQFHSPLPFFIIYYVAECITQSSQSVFYWQKRTYLTGAGQYRGLKSFVSPHFCFFFSDNVWQQNNTSSVSVLCSDHLQLRVNQGCKHLIWIFSPLLGSFFPSFSPPPDSLVSYLTSPSFCSSPSSKLHC